MSICLNLYSNIEEGLSEGQYVTARVDLRGSLFVTRLLGGKI